MRHPFPLFQNHLDLAHSYWAKILQPGDIAIDATCGNGQDTLRIASLAIKADTGEVYGYDIQSDAIASTSQLLDSQLSSSERKRVHLINQCHSTFCKTIQPDSVKLIVYNLGYLPGGNKALTTQVSTTIESLKNGLPLLKQGGLISLTCYPGHEEGAEEEERLRDFCSSLSPKEWSCCHHSWLNRKKSPSLLIIQKNQ